MCNSLHFGSFWYSGQVLLNIEDIRVIFLKDHYQVMQHGDVSVENANIIIQLFILYSEQKLCIS